jgi:hypothetical protein
MDLPPELPFPNLTLVFFLQRWGEMSRPSRNGGKLGQKLETFEQALDRSRAEVIRQLIIQQLIIQASPEMLR